MSTEIIIKAEGTRQGSIGVTTHTLPASSNTSDAVSAVMALGPFDCRWPIGEVDKPGFHFCSKPRVHGSYCETHAALAHEGNRRSGKWHEDRLEWARRNPSIPMAQGILRRYAEGQA